MFSLSHFENEHEVTVYSMFGRGVRTRVPEFLFSAKFAIGLHVILQIQIKEKEKKIKTASYH